jgi:hypothetical protein
VATLCFGRIAIAIEEILAANRHIGADVLTGYSCTISVLAEVLRISGENT